MDEQHGEPRTKYRSYLLRLWRTGEHGPWRAMLEPVGRDERHNFANLHELYAFLDAQTGQSES